MRVEKHLNNIYAEMPEKLKIVKLGTIFETTLNENIRESVKDDEAIFICDTTILTARCDDLDELKGALVKLKYTQDREYAVINKGIMSATDVEYQEYREFVSYVKQEANKFYEEVLG